MTKEEKIIKLKRMLREAPEIMTPIKVNRFSPLGKNHIYTLIRTGELRSFVYQQSYIIAKCDLIEYLAEHSDDKSRRKFTIAQGAMKNDATREK